MNSLNTKTLKKKIGWFFLGFGAFFWIITSINILLEGYKSILKEIDVTNYPVVGFIIFYIICLPMIIGSILLINED